MADTLPLAEAKSLVARARAGDFAALERLYRTYERPVYTLARRLTQSAEDAEDVLQETFLEVCRSLKQWRGEGSLWGWVRTIAASKAPMRFHVVSTVRSAAFRSSVLSLAKTCSIGLRSGL